MGNIDLTRLITAEHKAAWLALVDTMRSAWSDLAAADTDITDDANWPAVPPGVAALAARFQSGLNGRFSHVQKRPPAPPKARNVLLKKSLSNTEKISGELHCGKMAPNASAFECAASRRG